MRKRFSLPYTGFGRRHSLCGVNLGGIPSPIVGCLVPLEDPDALARELIRVLSDDSFASQPGAQAHARAQDFSWDRAIEKYEQVFERLA